MNRRTRIGVYGVAVEDNKILLITQEEGGYRNKFDLPGGGIEFGESVEEALRREFLEELGATFSAMSVLENVTTLNEVPKTAENDLYVFYRIGLIYKIEGLAIPIEYSEKRLQYGWYDPLHLSEEGTSPLAWQIIKNVIRSMR